MTFGRAGMFFSLLSRVVSLGSCLAPSRELTPRHQAVKQRAEGLGSVLHRTQAFLFDFDALVTNLEK